MSRHALDRYQTPSSTGHSSPTNSTDYLVKSPAPAYMPHEPTASSSTAHVGSGSDSGSGTGSRSSLRRSRRLSERSLARADHERDEASQSHATLTPGAHAPPPGPPPSGLSSLPSHISRSARPSEEHAPSITPSAMEAGHAKDMRCSQADASGVQEKETDVSGDKVWPPWKREDGWRAWRSEWVKKEALVVPLIVQALSAGVLDATTYADFMTFASNQTGNTILLCVSVAGTIEVIIKLTAISLGAFLSAAFVFGHMGHYFGLRNRGWIIATTTWQIVTLLLAAILVSPHGPAIFHIGGTHEWFILFLFAHMSGAQVAQARQSSNQELPTAPMTSSYVDLMSEKYLFVGFRHKKAGPRNRKLAYTSSMIIGGLLGAVIHRFAGSWEVVVVTMMLKVFMLGLVCRAKADDKAS